MDKRPQTASELESKVQCLVGAGDYRLTIHKSPVNGWHAMVHGNRQAEVDRIQAMADVVAEKLSQQYDLVED